MIAAVLSFALVPYNLALIEQKSLQKKQEQLAPAQAVYDQYRGMNSLIEQVRYGNALTMNSNDGILDFLAELEQKLPQDVEVTEFTSNDEQCIITMRVSDKETAAGVIKMLREFITISSLSVESILEESENEAALGDNSETSVVFTVNANYVIQTPAPPQVVESMTETAETEAAATAE